MAKTFSQHIVGGQVYKVLDEDARGLIAAEVDARKSSIADLNWINDLPPKEYDTMDLGTITQGYSINLSGGVNQSSAWSRTSWRPINGNTALLFTSPKTNNEASIDITAAIAFYSSNTADSFISSVPLQSGNSVDYRWVIVDVPVNARYYRVTLINNRESEYKMIGLGAPDTTISEIKNNLDQLQTIVDNSEVYSKNLMGEYAVVRYPVDIQPGEYVNVMTYDKSNFDEESTLHIQLLSADGTQIKAVRLNNSSYYYRRFSNDTGVAAKYLRWSEEPDTKLMVTKGTKNVDYIPYVMELKSAVHNNTEALEDLKTWNTTNIMASDNGYYPVNLNAGDRITVVRLDRTIFDISSTQALQLFDEDMQLITAYGLNSGLIYKTTLYNHSKTAKYCHFYQTPDTEMLVTTDADYTKYIYNAELIVPSYQEDERKSIIRAANITTVTDLYEGEFNIDPFGIYALKTSQAQGRSFSVYAYVDSAWKQVHLVNIHTGKSSLVEWEYGEYLLDGTYGANKIKIVSPIGYNNFCVLFLVKYPSVPYIEHPVGTTKFMPDYTDHEALGLTHCFGFLDGYVYGFTGKTIQRVDLSTKTLETFYTDSTVNISGACLLDNGNIVFCGTLGENICKIYLLKNGTAVEKMDFYNEEYDMKLTPNSAFSYHAEGSKVIVCEYNGSKEPISGYHAYLSNDYGETWSLLFDLESLMHDPSTRNFHLHSCVYDKYGDMFWACSGDNSTIDQNWYSLDGTNWYPCSYRVSVKATEIVPTKDYVLFLSDNGTVMAYKWNRKDIAPGETLYMDTVKTFVQKWNGACPIGAKAYYDEKMDLVFFGFYTYPETNVGYDGDLLKYSDLFVTDGFRVKQLFKDNVEIGLRGVYGCDDYIAISRTDKTILFDRTSL